jgi:PAS domain S-box-containing protein
MAIAVAVAVVAVVFGFILPLNAADRSATNWVEHTHEVIEATDQIQMTVEDIETGQRGFLLTGDTTYLEPYNEGIKSIWYQYLVARGLTADDPRQQTNLQNLADLLRNKMAVIDQTITLARGGNIGGSIDLLRAGEGKRLMNKIRETIGDVIAEEKRLLQERRDQAQQLQRQSTRVLIVLTILGVGGSLVVGILLAWALMTRATTQRIAVETADRRRLLAMVNVAAVMLREVDGTIHFWSDGCQRLYGWTAEQAVGRSSHELLQTVFPVSLADIDATLLRTGSWNGELRHRSQDGGEVIVMANKTVHDHADGSGRLIVETLTDVSALRQAQTELRKSEAQFRSLVDTAADGFVIARPDGRILSVNQAMLNMFGYERAEELIDQNLRILMPAADGERHDGYIAVHRAGAPPRVIGEAGRELLAVRRDGSEFPIDLSVSSFGTDDARCLSGIIRDATARKQAEAALRERPLARPDPGGADRAQPLRGVPGDHRTMARHPPTRAGRRETVSRRGTVPA